MSAKLFGNIRDLPYTIVIGLGGGGIEVIRKLVGIKEALKNVYDSDDIDHLILHVFDTDKYEAEDLESKNIATILDYPKNLRKLLDEYILKKYPWFPDPKSEYMEFFKKAFEGGLDLKAAAQTRVFGRYAFFHNYQKIKNTILDIFNRVKEKPNKVLVFVVAGLSGGTGSGMFLDMLALIRDLMDEIGLQGTIGLIVTLSDIISKSVRMEDITASLNANTYAALKELYYYQSMGEYYFIPPEASSYDKVHRVPINSSPPADIIFIVSSSNGEIIFQSREEQSKTIARFISAVAFNREIFMSNFANMPVQQKLKKMDATGKYRTIFSSFGLSMIKLPVDTIAKFFSYYASNEALKEVLSRNEEVLELAEKKYFSRINGILEEFVKSINNNFISNVQSLLAITGSNVDDVNIKSVLKRMLKDKTSEFLYDEIMDGIKEITNAIENLELDKLAEIKEVQRILTSISSIKVKTKEAITDLLGHYGGLFAAQEFVKRLSISIKGFMDYINGINLNNIIENQKEQVNEAKEMLDPYVDSIIDAIADIIDFGKRESMVEDFLDSILILANLMIKMSIIKAVKEKMGLASFIEEESKKIKEVVDHIGALENSVLISMDKIRRETESEESVDYLFKEKLNSMVNRVISGFSSNYKEGWSNIIKHTLDSISRSLIEIIKEMYTSNLSSFNSKEILDKVIKEPRRSLKKRINEIIEYFLIDSEEVEAIRTQIGKAYKRATPFYTVEIGSKGGVKGTDDYFRISTNMHSDLANIFNKYQKNIKNWNIDISLDPNYTVIRVVIGFGPENLERFWKAYSSEIDKRPLHIFERKELLKMPELVSGVSSKNFVEPEKLLTLALECGVITVKKGGYYYFRGQPLYLIKDGRKYHSKKAVVELIVKSDLVRNEIIEDVRKVLLQADDPLKFFIKKSKTGDCIRKDIPLFIVNEIAQKRDLILPPLCS